MVSYYQEYFKIYVGLKNQLTTEYNSTQLIKLDNIEKKFLQISFTECLEQLFGQSLIFAVIP